MLELARELLPLLDGGETVAVATVTRVARSAPRGAGSALAVTASGRVIGSISGGCVEGDTVVLATHALSSGVGSAASFGFSDAEAHAAGLACGGSVAVVVSVIRPASVGHEALERVAACGRARVGIVATGPDTGLVVTAPTGVHETDGASMLPGAYDGHDVLVVSRAPLPRLLLLGAGEHAAALCRVGSAAGFRVSVCDPWERLVTPERFPAAVELVTDYPDQWLSRLPLDDLDDRTAICVLTHDERLDVPALRVALGLPVGFVGAMGARSTVARRAALLQQSGVSASALGRLHTPLGLDLGGVSPDETALAVLAEIVATRRGGSGLPLRERSGPLHVSAEAHGTDSAALSCSAVGTP